MDRLTACEEVPTVGEMVGDPALRTQPALGRYITLRRPQIHRENGRLERVKRRCCRAYSPVEASPRMPVDPLGSEPPPAFIGCRTPCLLSGQPTACETPTNSSGLCHALARSSPLERETGWVLSVALGDRLNTCEATAGPPGRTLGKLGSDRHSGNGVETSRANGRLLPVLESPSLDSGSRGKQDPQYVMPTPLRVSPAGIPCGVSQPWTPSEAPVKPSEAPGPRPPLHCSRWELSPYISTIRSKLEGFAEIFLSPILSHLPWAVTGPRTPVGAEGGGGPAEASDPTPGAETRLSHALGGPRERGTPRDPARLSRSLSCPEIRPPTTSLRHPLPLPAPCPGARHRRHTLAGVEPGREIGPLPSLLCLRKEVFPAGGVGRAVPDWRAHPPPGEGAKDRGQLEKEEERRRSFHGHRQGPPQPRSHEFRMLPLQSSGPAECTPSPREHNTPKKRRLNVVQHEPSEGETLDQTSDVNRETGEGKVSRIRIRKAPVRLQSNLTPMGLPKPARLNKKEFSLEEIYTNKNYKAPLEKRSFETIFEEPVERGGLLVLTSQRRLRRAVEFQDGGLPRKRRLRQRLRLAQRGCGGLRSVGKGPEMELLLRERLSELDLLFTEES